MARKPEPDAALPMMAMDNFEIKVVARSQAVLERVVEIALCSHPSIDAYTEMDIQGIKTLVLLWHYDPTSAKDPKTNPPIHKLPASSKLKQLVPMIMGWLEAQDYGPEDDFDGSSSKGWRLFNAFSGHRLYRVGQPYQHLGTYVAFAVQPEWAEHHK